MSRDRVAHVQESTKRATSAALRKISALPLPQQQRIDRLADQFEREFKTGQNPRIEAYLDQVPALRTHLLRELIALEVELRRSSSQGGRIDWEASRDLPKKQGVFKLTRRIDRGILRAVEHAETGAAKAEPSDRNNDGKRFAYSRVIGPRSEVEQVYSFTATKWDVEATVYYYRHRYYAAQLGRFASTDPIGYGDCVLILYRYVHNCPTVNGDPFGLQENRSISGGGTFVHRGYGRTGGTHYLD